jgi:NAD(P)-dependent dehydrogenase (short-subunit alcohol dehydrogenase family)
LGEVYARELLERGAAKVYGAARNRGAVSEPGVVPVSLDITDVVRAEVAVQCPNGTLLVNNAGVLRYSSFVGAPTVDAARSEMATNYFGTLSMCGVFAPVLGANGGGAIVDMRRSAGCTMNPLDASYGASKAASWFVDERHPHRTGGSGNPRRGGCTGG